MSEKAESGTVLAVCVSREKGTQKQNVGSAHFIEDFGIEGDAHAIFRHERRLLSQNLL